MNIIDLNKKEISSISGGWITRELILIIITLTVIATTLYKAYQLEKKSKEIHDEGFKKGVEEGKKICTEEIRQSLIDKRKNIS